MRSLIVAVVLLAFLAVGIHASLPTQFSELSFPFPQPKWLPTVVYQIDYTNRTQNEMMAIISISGMLAKVGLTQPEGEAIPLLFKYIEGDSLQPYYWEYYQQKFPMTQFDNTTLNSVNIEMIIEMFSGYTTGYFIADASPSTPQDSVNIALSACGYTEGAIVVGPELASFMNGFGIPLLKDYRGMDEYTYVSQFYPFNPSSNQPWPFSKRFFSVQVSGKSVQYLSDWAIFANVLQIHHIPTIMQLFKEVTVPIDSFTAWLGWTADNWSENQMTGNFSQNGGMVWAADVMPNFATHAYFTAELPMRNPTHVDNSKLPDNTGKHTVSFLFSDGDSICADAEGIFQRYTMPTRGQVPISWGLDPSLAHLTPGILQYYYDHATVNDSFIGFSPGYAYPDYMDEHNRWKWAQLGGEHLLAADMSVNYFIGFNYSVEYFGPSLAQWNVAGVVYFDYPNYYVLQDNRNGTVTWVYEKPCIAVRESLWGGHSTPDYVAAVLNKQKRDPTTVDGYSVIVVHVWSMDVNDIISTVEALDDDIMVVNLDVLVALMSHNVVDKTNPSHSSTSAEPVKVASM